MKIPNSVSLMGYCEEEDAIPQTQLQIRYGWETSWEKPGCCWKRCWWGQ